MLDLLAATAALIVIVALLVAAALALAVAPFVVGTSTAEARGWSPSRAGLLTLVGVGAGLLGAGLVVRSDLPTPLAVLPLALCWVGPVLLRVLPERASVFTGRRGLHER